MTNYENSPGDCILIYISGYCPAQRGRASFAVTIRRIVDGREVKMMKIVSTARETTAAQREVAALLAALRCLKRDEQLRVIIRSDLKYVLQGASEWLANWKERGWKAANRKPIEVPDLWKQIDSQLAELSAVQIEFQWVPSGVNDARNVEVTEMSQRQVAA